MAKSEKTYPEVEDSKVVLHITERGKIEELAGRLSGQSRSEQGVRDDTAEQTDEGHDPARPAEAYFVWQVGKQDWPNYGPKRGSCAHQATEKLVSKGSPLSFRYPQD